MTLLHVPLSSLVPEVMSLKAAMFVYTQPRFVEIASVRPRRVKMAPTIGDAALVPTEGTQPSFLSYSAIAPSKAPGSNSAAAATSTEARLVHEPKAFGVAARNVVWKAGIANSVLHPLPPAPPLPSSQTISM